MFMSSERTQFDLSWQMFGIPIRVSPWFWVTAAFLGWGYQSLGFEYLLTWIACVFVSILIHEMGHVLAFRTLGSDAHILLYSFGGLAFGDSDPPRRWQRITVSLAGPGAQFILLGIVYLLMNQYEADLFINRRLLVLAALRMLFDINLFWPLLNLLPIWPLDGGQVSRELCQQFFRRNAVRISLQISLVVSAALALNALAAKLMPEWPIPWLTGGGLFMVIFFALFAVQSWLELQQLQPRTGYRREYEEPERLPWEQDPDAWKRGGWKN